MMEAGFLNYIKSLVLQAMIFMGLAPSPITNQMGRNLKQAKLLLDTLVMLQKKTEGNLTQEESSALNNAVYTLNQKYEEIIQEEDDD